MAPPFLATARGLLFSPRKTFSGLRTEEIESAFTYFLGILAIFVILMVLSRIVLLWALFIFLSFGVLNLLALIEAIVETIVTVIAGVIGTVITGVWIHLWVYLLGGRRGITETLRATFYAFTPVGLFGWIPPLFAGTALLGSISLPGWGGFPGLFGIGIIAVVVVEILLLAWGFLIAVFGVTGFQGMPEGKAANAVLIAFLIPLVLAIAGFIFLLSLNSAR